MTERTFLLSGRRVWVAGHRGLVGSAIVRRLARESCEVMTVGRERLDLTEQEAVRRWLGEERPDAVIVAAARVGGILANDSEPVPFLRDNLMIATNVIDAAHQAGVKKLLFLGSSCIYPRLAPQPMREEHLLTGELEPTNQWYAVAKIAGLKLAAAYRRQYGADFIAAMPTNLYGSGDNFDLATAHVVPALMRKAHEAKAAGLPSITVWGTGTPRRELLHVDDLADACVFLLQHYSAESHINVGTGTDVSISELAHSIAEVVGFQGELRFDRSRPDGAPRKLLDVSRLSAMGWTAGIPLRQGLEQTYRWFVENLKAGADIRARRPA